MKTFKGSALLAALIFITLTNKVSCQAVASDIALAFPVRIEMSALNRLIAENSSEWNIWASAQQGLASGQTLANGKPLPEAESLLRLLKESFQRSIEARSITLIDLNTMRMLGAKSNAALLEAEELKGARYFLCTLYAVEGTMFRFCMALLDKSGQGSTYFSDPVDVFSLSNAVQSVTENMILRGIFSAKEVIAPSMTNTPANLPKIEPWLLKSRYEKANNSFKFAIGGLSISLSAAFLSTGLWQTYEEAAVRNSAFNSAVTISGIAAGASIAATAIFLTTAIWNAVTILQTTR